jgi:hypothetical protein
MEKVSATYRLIRRGGVYYRRRVPTHLVETIGKEVIQQSLNTTCPIQGRKLRVGEDLEWDARFDVTDKNSSASDGSI